jgi:acetyl esterase
VERMPTLMAPLIPIDQPFEVSVDDVEYQRPDGTPLLARVYRPATAQPRAAMLDVHGGAWVLGDRTQHQALDQAIAASGVVIASIDFRQPPGNPYPTSLIDVNLGTRWLKQQAAGWGLAEDAKIGLFGGSSGGHVVILSAMRPADPRYTVLELPGGSQFDARVDFVVTDAPVTDPQTRYEQAMSVGNTQLVERHGMYWTTADGPIEGNPNRILERGEAVELPPLFISQGEEDQSVPLAGTQEFVERYRAAGGEVELLTFPGVGHGFILQDPQRPESVAQARAVLHFISRQVQ